MIINYLFCVLTFTVSIITTLVPAGAFAAPTPTECLSSFNYGYAGVLIRTKWPTKPSSYILLGCEAYGKDKGTWDVFGGSRDATDKHPVITAARELEEETIGLIKSNVLRHIDIDSGFTKTIVANRKKKSVIYITDFSPSDLEVLTTNFYDKRAFLATSKNKKNIFKHREKDALAWIKWDNFLKAIATAPRDKSGTLVTPIKVWANRILSNGKKVAQEITLRPLLVSSLQSYCQNASNYTTGKNSNIRFYKH